MANVFTFITLCNYVVIAPVSFSFTPPNLVSVSVSNDLTGEKRADGSGRLGLQSRIRCSLRSLIESIYLSGQVRGLDGR